MKDMHKILLGLLAIVILFMLLGGKSGYEKLTGEAINEMGTLVMGRNRKRCQECWGKGKKCKCNNK